jgi:hypothetical protein
MWAAQLLAAAKSSIGTSEVVGKPVECGRAAPGMGLEWHPQCARTNWFSTTILVKMWVTHRLSGFVRVHPVTEHPPFNGWGHSIGGRVVGPVGTVQDERSRSRDQQQEQHHDTL